MREFNRVISVEVLSNLVVHMENLAIKVNYRVQVVQHLVLIRTVLFTFCFIIS